MPKLREHGFQNEGTFTETGIGVAGAVSSASGAGTGRDDDWRKSETDYPDPAHPSQSESWGSSWPCGDVDRFM